MIEWRDEAVILERRRHGETHAIVDLFARAHGRWRGLVHGGAARRIAPVIEPGNRVSVTWRARLIDQLGHFLIEPVQPLLPFLLGAPLRLKVWEAARSLLLAVLPERHADADLFAALEGLLQVLALDEVTPGELGGALARFELAVLAAAGVALSLDRCAATDVSEDLIYVSPRSGRAVSRAAGAPYAARLLPLPAFLRADPGDNHPPDRRALEEAFRLSGHFLERHVFAAIHRPLPPARAAAIAALLKAVEAR